MGGIDECSLESSIYEANRRQPPRDETLLAVRGKKEWESGKEEGQHKAKSRRSMAEMWAPTLSTSAANTTTALAVGGVLDRLNRRGNNRLHPCALCDVAINQDGGCLTYEAVRFDRSVDDGRRADERQQKK